MDSYLHYLLYMREFDIIDQIGDDELRSLLSYKDKQGFNAIHIACVVHDCDLLMVKRFIRLGCSPIALSKEKITPYHLAVLYGRCCIAKYLSDNWWDTNASDSLGNTAIALAKNAKININRMIEMMVKEHGHYVKRVPNKVNLSRYPSMNPIVTFDYDKMLSHLVA